MASFIELIAKIKQKNNGTFKLVDAQDVECEDGKGLDEVLNEKLDKNQGVENVGKTMVVGADGNLVVGDPSPKNVYTKEEVDYLLDDKMDKPYYDIAIADDTTIENTLAGNFKMDSIEGSIYQAEESGIVPTPERPIPIRSKKITFNDEVVELRSLKESVNIFSLDDFYITNKVNCTVKKITDGLRLSNLSGVRDSYIELNFNLKANKTYTISFTADTTNSSFVSLVDNRLFSLAESNWNNPNWSIKLGSEKGIKSYKQTFTPSIDCKVFLYAMNLALSEQEGYVDFTNIMLVEGDSAPSSYVAPTVRDYKIVDHTTKTSKIVRNVKNIRVTSKLINNGFNDYTETMKRAIIRTLDRFVIDNVTKAGNDLSNMAITRFGSLQNGNVFADVSGIANMYWYPDISMFGLNGSEEKDVASQKLVEFLTNNEMYVQYQLATPVEETITYVETDVSEVGYSWQDTTSPSPDIKSEIYEVDEINVKTVGKNLLNEERLQDFNNYDKTLSSRGFTEYILNLKPNTQYTISRRDTVGYQQGAYIKVNNILHDQNTGAKWLVATHSKGENRQNVTMTTNSDGLLVLLFNNTIETIKSILERIGYLQVEEGDVATSHDIYQETSIQHTLSKPLRATKDGSIKDIIDIVNMQITYNMTDFIVDGNTTITLGTDKEKTRVIQINSFPFLNPTNNLKMCCDKLVNDSGKDEELFTVSTALYIAINKNRVAENDISEFKKWFGENPLYFIGISKNPTTEPLDDELVEKLKTLKTFSSVTHVFVEGIAKPKLNAKYPKDIAAAQAQLEAKVITLQEAVIKNV